MKILVLGGEGMLGHKMFQTLRHRVADTACTIRGRLSEPLYTRVPLFTEGSVEDEFDAMDWPRVQARLRKLRPDIIVNCVGIIKQRTEALVAIPSIAINSLLPHQLAALQDEWGGRVIHFSTDCVFSGDIGGYTEESVPDARDLYGLSKLLGEVTADNALTLRTSIIGRELVEFKSLLEWLLSNRGGRIRGFRKVIYAGVTTNYIAELVGRIVVDHPTLSGLYQVTSPPIDKYSLLCWLRDAYALEIEIEPDDEVVSDRSMLGDSFLRATGYELPSWSALVRQLAEDPTPYEEWRGEP